MKIWEKIGVFFGGITVILGGLAFMTPEVRMCLGLESTTKRLPQFCLAKPLSSQNGVLTERSAGEVLENINESQEAWRRRKRFEDIYLNKHIGTSGWVGKVLKTPELKNPYRPRGSEGRDREQEIWQVRIVEDNSGALVLLESDQDLSSLRPNDKVRFDGILVQYEESELLVSVDNLFKL